MESECYFLHNEYIIYGVSDALSTKLNDTVLQSMLL
jgi:hypothetical protein